jgi:hypothetical protein
LFEDRNRCPGCGLPIHETADPEADWTAEAVACRACEAKDRVASRYQSGSHRTAGLLIYPVRDD